jgi:hypothetical protein
MVYALSSILELEENDSIPFLDVLINKKHDGILGHTVYRKKTHTENYLHTNSHHHPNQKLGVLKTLAMRAIRISDKEHFVKEKDHLIFRNIGYNNKDINNAINKAKEKMNITQKPHDNQTLNNNTTYLPFIQGVTYKIARVLNKKEIKTSFKPHETIKQNM